MNKFLCQKKIKRLQTKDRRRMTKRDCEIEVRQFQIERGMLSVEDEEEMLRGYQQLVDDMEIFLFLTNDEKKMTEDYRKEQEFLLDYWATTSEKRRKEMLDDRREQEEDRDLSCYMDDDYEDEERERAIAAEDADPALDHWQDPED